MIPIESKNGKSQARVESPLLSLISPATLGFASFLSWQNLLFVSKSLFAGAAATGKLPLYTHLISVLALTLALAIEGTALKRRHRTLTVGRILLTGSIIATAASVPFMAHCGLDSASGLILMALGGVLSGAGSSFLFLAWGTRFRSIGCARTLTEAAVASLYAALAGVFIDFAPLTFRIGIIMALPIASGLLLAQAEKAAESWTAPSALAGQPPAEPASSAPYTRPQKVFFARGIVCMLFLGIVTGLLKEPLFALTEFSSSHTLELLLLATLAVAVIVVACASARIRGICSILYRCAFGTLSLSIVVLLVGGEPSDPSVWLFLFGTAGVQTLLWGVLADIRAPFDDTARVLGFGLAALYAGIFLGSIISYGATALHAPSPLVVNPLAATILLGVAYSFILPDRSIEGDHPAAEPPSGTEPAPQEAAFGPSREERVAALAREHGLTPRETEVFELIAQGHTGKRIEEVLAMSASTVKTHRYRIYEKMGVATKQELVDLVEGDKTASPS